YIQDLSEQLNVISNQVTVVTSDQAVQWTIFSRGASRLPSYELYRRIKEMKRQLTQESRQHHDRSIQRNNPWREDQLELLTKLRDQLSS
ncbi:NYN domain-containing protein, partial [Lactobacillus sp. XV13L]|nr:NYN domain-containing protein [Lactobacillus sp. XV13L]